jgi:hypothetical protein
MRHERARAHRALTRSTPTPSDSPLPPGVTTPPAVAVRVAVAALEARAGTQAASVPVRVTWRTLARPPGSVCGGCWAWPVSLSGSL